VFAIMQASYEVLAAAGFTDDAILDEMYLSGEPAEVFDRVAQLGLLGQLGTHSRTSQYGQLGGLARSGDLVAALRERFGAILHAAILSGTFAQDWTGRQAHAEETIAALREQAGAHPLIVAEQQVRNS
jgi:ketol-acid reductoisomerase